MNGLEQFPMTLNEPEQAGTSPELPQMTLNHANSRRLGMIPNNPKIFLLKSQMFKQVETPSGKNISFKWQYTP